MLLGLSWPLLGSSPRDVVAVWVGIAFAPPTHPLSISPQRVPLEVFSNYCTCWLLLPWGGATFAWPQLGS